MLDPYAPMARLVGKALLVVLTLLAMWWLIMKPRSDLAAERAAHAHTRSEHAATMAEIAAQTAAVADAAARARDTYETKTKEDARVHAEEVAAAFKRGVAIAVGIRDGSIRVQDVWRDRECPAAAAGEGAGPGRGAEAVSAGRAAAIGEVLGLGGTFDADYAQCYARLKSAQKLLNQCYENGGP